MLLPLAGLTVCTSCTESDDSVEEYVDWQKRNTEYFSQIHSTAQQAISAGSKKWKLIPTFSKTVGGNVVWCASLELKRQALEGGTFPRYLVNHLATTLIWRQFLQPFLLAIQHAYASRAVHLMATEGIEITIQRLHINTEVGGSLCSVNHHRNTMLVRHTDNIGNGVDGTQHVADVGDAHQLRFS